MAQHWNIVEKEYGTILTLLHDWDLDIANQFLAFVEGNFNPENHKNFIFDLHKVSHIDSMVIGIIINISKRIKKSGGQVFIMKPSEVVEKLLHDVGLLSYFNIIHSEEELQNTSGSNE